ncbi:MAG: hypothetical protein JXR25_08695, partial [Pontiellaceae bacterium]|nr:hypothetical protein [Pontiellaceae bacterium]
MKTRIILITMLAAGAAMAQQEEKRPERKPPTAADFIQRLDKDGDGLVSATEFDGPADHFAMMDTNGDGLISESEVLPAPSPKEMKPNEEKAEGANCGEG